MKLNEKDNLVEIDPHRSTLLQQCKKRYSIKHKLANLVVLSYMGLGLALPLGGLTATVLGISVWLASISKLVLPEAYTAILGNFGAFFMIFTMLWIAMTPLCVILICYLRRLVALIPPAICAAWIIFFGCLTQLTKSLPQEFIGLAAMVSFLIGAYFGTKCTIKVIRNIRSEGPYWFPEVLGCRKLQRKREHTLSTHDVS